MDIAISTTGRHLLKALFAVLCLLLYAPLALIVVFSFNDADIPTELPEFPFKGLTLNAYREFIANPELTAALVTSAKVAAAASAAAVVLGLLASMALVRRKFFGKALASAFLLSPLVIPYVVFGIALLILFHEISFPLSMWTIVIGHTVIALPFTILILSPRLARIDVRLEEAAYDLGASGFRTFRSITLPLMTPAVVSAFLVAYVVSFDEVVIAQFVAGNTVTFPIYLFSQLRFPTNFPQVLAVAVVVMAASLLVVLAAEIGRRIVERRLHIELEGRADEAPPPTSAEPAAPQAERV